MSPLKTDPLPGARVFQFERIGTTTRRLLGNALPFGFRTMAQCQNNRTDHRNQKNNAGELEQQHVLRVHDLANRLGI